MSDKVLRPVHLRVGDIYKIYAADIVMLISMVGLPHSGFVVVKENSSGQEFEVQASRLRDPMDTIENERDEYAIKFAYWCRIMAFIPNEDAMSQYKMFINFPHNNEP